MRAPAADLHLAKTGGITLNDIIVRNLSSGEYLVIEMPPRDEFALWTWSNAELTRALAGMAADAVERIRAVLGHYGPGVQRHLPKPCAVVTILRNPVDRLLSYFYYDVQRGVRSDANWRIRGAGRRACSRQLHDAYLERPRGARPARQGREPCVLPG